MNSILQKLLAATGLTRRGELVEATQAIQRALSGAVHDVAPVPPAAEARFEAREGVELDLPPEAERTRTGRFSESSFTAEAGTRSFKLFEPAGFEGRVLPLVVMLHGCTQDPDDFAAGTRMNALAQEHGLVVLYPAQAPRSNAHKCWNWFVPADQRRGGHGEPDLLAGMTRHVMAIHRIDADRVFVAGLSAGGAMAAILAREYPDLFAAAGIHSGLPPGAAHDVMSAFGAMKSGALAARPDAAGSAPVIVFHGDADSTVNALNGSHVVDAALGAAPTQATRETSPAAHPGRAFTRTVYRPADSTASAPTLAEHWVVHGAGHAWAGGDSAGSFTERDAPDASREMLRFFAEHPRRSA